MTQFDETGIDSLLAQAALARRAGDVAAALDAYGLVLAIDPGHAPALLAAAEINRCAGQPATALMLCRDLIESCPGHVGARLEMAESLSLMGCSDEAHALMALLLHERPDAPLIWCGLGRLLTREGRRGAARAALERALRLDRSHAPSWAALGRLFAAQGEHGRAADALRLALALDPDQAAASSGLAATLLALGRPREAAARLERALAIDPLDVEAHLLRSALAAGQGRLGESWADAEWRHHLSESGSSSPALPDTLDGRHLLLLGEGRPSLCLRMLRFVPALVARGAVVSLMAPPALVPLLAGQDGLARVWRDDGPRPDRPSPDHVLSLGDLPHRLGADPLALPPPPILRLSAARQRQVLAPPSTLLRIGLAWRGERASDSLPLLPLLGLATLPGAVLFGLDDDSALRRADPALITDLGPTIGDCADLAARLVEMDLVIAADGLTAELAATLGRPVWLLLPADADPRWGGEADSTPWYPGLRLFRAERDDDGSGQIGRVRAALAEALADQETRRAALWQAASGPTAIQAAWLGHHLGPGDLLIEIGDGTPSFALDALADPGCDIRVLSICPHAGRAAALAALLDDRRAEILCAAPADRERPVLVSPRPRSGRRQFELPDWLAIRTRTVPLDTVLAARPEVEERRTVLRIDQPGWETAILDGLGERLHPERIAMVIVPHHPGDTASTLLARAGFALYCFPGRLARGPLAPFTDEEGLILALAPWVRPAAFYGPDIWPPLPERIDEAGAEAARLGKAGLAATRGGAGSDADRILAQALIRDPFCPAANAGKGRMLAEDGRLEAAALFLTRALLPGPDPTVSAELAQVLRRLRRFDEAEAAHRAASPGADTAESVFAGALIARDRGRLIDAARLLQRAAALAPGDAMITVAAAELRLADGDPAGLAGLAPSAPPPPPGAPPLWSGEPLEARTLLVSCGDDIALALMLARYIPLIPGRGGLVALICPAELGPLLALLPGVESVANPDDPLPEADLWAPLVALPSLLERRAPPRPPGVPYLVWPEAATRRRFGSDDRLRIGLAGAEGVCPLDLLLLLAAEPDIALVALGGAEVDNVIAAAGAGALVERPSPLPEDLAETVALIAGLDLVLGGDGVETHLAGALGKPVWVLLPEGFSWLWPTARDNSPFYPTARLFRPTAEGWAPTIERMREALLALAADKRQRGASFI